MRVSTAIRPAKSIASSRQSRTVWFTSGMVRYLAIAGMFSRHAAASGKHRGHQIVSLHALKLWRHLAPAAAPRHRKRDRRVPAPARLEHRRVEKRLHEDVARVAGWR
jgi:hypothetical protein